MFNRHDICTAYNLFSQHYGWDDYTYGIQARLDKIRFKPARSEEFLSGLSDNARGIYDAMVYRRVAPIRQCNGQCEPACKVCRDMADQAAQNEALDNGY